MKDLDLGHHQGVERLTLSGGKIGAEQLFREHAPFVAAFLHRLGVRETDVEDAVQEVFVVAHQKGGYAEGPAQPRSWLGAIAVRIAAASRRKSARRCEDHDEDVLEAALGQGRSPGEVAEAQAELRVVQKALDTLDLEHRATLVLFEIESESCLSIAEAMAVPVGTVYSRLHHARRRFAEAFERLTSAGRPSQTPSPAVGAQ